MIGFSFVSRLHGPGSTMTAPLRKRVVNSTKKGCGGSGTWLTFLLLIVACGVLPAPSSYGQETDAPAASSAPAETAAPAETDVADSPAASADEAAPAATGTMLGEGREINFFSLLLAGGAFMIPIAVMSLIAVTFSVERLIGLRRARVLPQGLVTALGQLGSSAGGFDPKKAYKICQQYNSAAATVIRAMLLKVGRPHSEVEHTVQETSQREAERMYANVRWLNLSAAVAPLLGLLGTVWGMIVAFHDTTLLAPGQNKAEFLAEGIYIALVTTLAGLMVAIPAAVMSHFFEGRIQAMFHQIDELVFSLLPQIERFEGRVRFGRQMEPGEDSARPDHSNLIEPPPVPENTAVAK